jgi:glycosyltransferase involved in cell wall biosynthesis
MKKVLFISYYFPPLGGMGSVRLARFARYLPEFGWHPRVLTVKTVQARLPRDDGLLEYIPRDIVISWADPLDLTALEKQAERFRAGTLFLGLSRVIQRIPPDGELGVAWLGPLYYEARRILARERIDAILTSSFPCVTHVAGYILKKATGIPWVADFRDEWSLHPQRTFRFSLQRKLDAWLEQQVLLTADHVVAATDAYIVGLASHVPPSHRDHRFTTITNSFDISDLESTRLAPNPWAQQYPTLKKFTVTYVGYLYGGVGFLSALENLLSKGMILANAIQVEIVGQIYPLMQHDGQILKEKVATLESKGVIKRTGWVSHIEAMRHLQEADVLLLHLHPSRGAATIPGKVFEYLSFGKPILALVAPDSAAAHMIRRTNAGTIVAPDDVKAIEELIQSLYMKWQQGELAAALNLEEIRKYEARVTTETLANVLTHISQ